jgi:hypothetical protein
VFVGYNRRTNDPRLQYILEGTSDFVTWSSAQARFQEVLSSATGDEFEAVINVMTESEDAAPAMKFFRVRAVFGAQQ